MSGYLGIETKQNFMFALESWLYFILSLSLNATTYKELKFVEGVRHGIIRLTKVI